MTKSEANYRDGKGARICSNCTMFRAPDRCTLVSGEISRGDVCDHFKPEKLSDAMKYVPGARGGYG